MEIVEGAEAPKVNKSIDYAKLSELYNVTKIGDAVAMDHEVYNITLFKSAIERRGVTSGTDFQAFNSKGKCYVKKLTDKPMEG